MLPEACQTGSAPQISYIGVTLFGQEKIDSKWPLIGRDSQCNVSGPYRLQVYCSVPMNEPPNEITHVAGDTGHTEGA